MIQPHEANPTNPYTQERIPAELASRIGRQMLEGAAEGVRRASADREAKQAEQLSRPLAPNAITEVPSDIKYN